MMRALYSSVAGLRTHQTRMDVIGNNISNVNTVGFKSSRTVFSTMMYQTTSFASGANAASGRGGVNAKQIGLGSVFSSTAIDIDTGGANENTGRAFDLKLSDKNTTSFFIVYNGEENIFTRAGAFYVDGAGNLCMESTGYTVMGWQADANGNIRKDTVTPLKVMAGANQVSEPEYTTQGVCNGILDDKTASINSDTGYYMNLNFFDRLGYGYTAKFAVQKVGEDKDGQFAVNLTDILDSTGKSILSGGEVTLSELFGSGNQGSNVDITDYYTMADGMANALKSLATTDKEIKLADGTTTARGWEYYFDADFVNENLGNKENGWELPSGYRVRYTVQQPTAPATDPIPVKYEIFDASGANVTQRYDTLKDKWIKPVAVKGQTTPIYQITKTETVIDMIQKWADNAQLKTQKDTDNNTIYSLTEQQIQKINSIFGTGTEGTNALTTNIASTANILVNIKDGKVQYLEAADPNETATVTAVEKLNGVTGTPTGQVTGVARDYTLYDYLKQGYIQVDAEEINRKGIFTTDLIDDLELRYKTGDNSFTIVTPTTDGFLCQFSTADGSLSYIGADGSTSQTLRMSLFRDEDNAFTDINIDFSTLKNLSNAASSTAGMSAGNSAIEGDDGKGKAMGTMIGLSVDQTGKIYGSYSNGNSRVLGQIAVARFANASGLESLGENCYKATMNSGEFDGIGQEIDSDGSSIEAGTLEMSNVDLATEFTQMITTQRGYQANSRVISTADSILEELVNLKR